MEKFLEESICCFCAGYVSPMTYDPLVTATLVLAKASGMQLSARHSHDQGVDETGNGVLAGYGVDS